VVIDSVDFVEVLNLQFLDRTRIVSIVVSENIFSRRIRIFVLHGVPMDGGFVLRLLFRAVDPKLVFWVENSA
jgi:hypothetical protein